MVFFNYSTMQMAAKVVFYGPGLCGKTTNLQWIFDHTSNDSRGEMVSLATETDRTLFFDLLPIDVGSIAGFSTRIQLYTVPGQVFYNTTRKLVLKGVDGVVFVADSQRPMMQANKESFQNLEENLAEMGLSLETIPLVLQYNKRDLPNIASIEELNQALNRSDWAHIGASALNGDGVLETLKMISKATLLALKKRLTKGREQPSSSGGSGMKARPAPRKPTPTPRPAPGREGTGTGSVPKPAPKAEKPAPMAAAKPKAAEPPREEELPAAAPAVEAAPSPEAPKPAAAPAASAERPMAAKSVARPEPPPRLEAPRPAAEPAVPFPELTKPAPLEPTITKPAPAPSASPAAAAAPAAVSVVAPAPARKRKRRGGLDALAELEKLRKDAIRPRASARNGKHEISKDFQLTLQREALHRARHFRLSLQLEDEQRQAVDEAQQLVVDIDNASELEKLLLRLNIALDSKP